MIFGLAIALAALTFVAACSSLSPNPPDPHENDPSNLVTADIDGGHDGGGDASKDAP